MILKKSRGGNMAYNNFYGPYQNAYNPYQQFQPNFQQQQQVPNNIQPSFQQSQQAQQIQNGGFVSVHNENEARNYPIAPGNSVTFKDENAPYVYTKTQGFSQLDRPVFEKYRLVKEEEYQPQQVVQSAPTSAENAEQANNIDYALKSDLRALWDEIEALKKQILKSKEEIKNKIEKTEVKTDE